MNYWQEALGSSLDEHAPNALASDQIAAIAKDMQMAAQMESEATGTLHIPHPATLEVARLHGRLEQEKQIAENREAILKDTIAARYGGKERVWVRIDGDRVEIEPVR